MLLRIILLALFVLSAVQSGQAAFVKRYDRLIGEVSSVAPAELKAGRLSDGTIVTAFVGAPATITLRYRSPTGSVRLVQHRVDTATIDTLDMIVDRWNRVVVTYAGAREDGAAWELRMVAHGPTGALLFTRLLQSQTGAVIIGVGTAQSTDGRFLVQYQAQLPVQFQGRTFFSHDVWLITTTNAGLLPVRTRIPELSHKAIVDRQNLTTDAPGGKAAFVAALPGSRSVHAYMHFKAQSAKQNAIRFMNSTGTPAGAPVYVPNVVSTPGTNIIPLGTFATPGQSSFYVLYGLAVVRGDGLGLHAQRYSAAGVPQGSAVKLHPVEMIGFQAYEALYLQQHRHMIVSIDSVGKRIAFTVMNAATNAVVQTGTVAAFQDIFVDSFVRATAARLNDGSVLVHYTDSYQDVDGATVFRLREVLLADVP